MNAIPSTPPAPFADTFFTSLESTLPPVFSREEAARQLGGILTAKTLTNIDCLGNGPEVRVRIGKKIGYERTSFISWLRGYHPQDGIEGYAD